MNRIDKDELFGHVSGYLKAKGVQLQDGPYTRTVQKGCHLLAESINLSRQAMERAKAELERTLEEARRIIHQKTAPKRPAPSGRPANGSSTQRRKPRKKPTGNSSRPAAT